MATSSRLPTTPTCRTARFVTYDALMNGFCGKLAVNLVQLTALFIRNPVRHLANIAKLARNARSHAACGRCCAGS
jgi:hypothetical protein